MIGGLTLRPHQTDGIDQLRAHLRQGLRRLVLEIPTGGGKTECAIAMIHAAIEKGGRVVFAVNRTQLLDQTVRRFEAAGLSPGVIQSTNTRNTHRRVLVASVQTLARRWEEMPSDITLLVIDEAHAAGGDTRYHELIAKVHASGHKTAVIGLTATPWARGMAKHYEALQGPLFQAKVTPTSAQALIDAGFLVDADIYAPSSPDMDGVKVVAGEWHEGQTAERMNTPKLVGDIVTHWLKLAGGKKTVVFASNIAHSEHIAQQFQRAGIDARHLDHHVKQEDKGALLAAFDAGEFTVLCNPLLLREGWDCPSVEVLVLARPTRSLISYVQIVGRVLRTSPGKERAIVLDHSGTGERLGFPTDDRSGEPLCDGKPKAGSDAEKKEKVDALPKPCTNCHFLKPALTRKCPACGHEAIRPCDIEVEEGDLVLKKKSAKHEAIDHTMRFGTKQQTYSMLLGIADERGYKSGWVSRKYKEIFGVWPKSMIDRRSPASPEIRSWVKAEAIRWANAKKKEDARAYAG